MSKNEFDELLLKKLREADFEYNPASWEKLSALLPPAAPTGERSFDELLLKKLQEEELEYKAEHWEQMATLLPPVLYPVANNNNLVPSHNKRKRWGLAAGIAAAVLLAMGTAVFIKQMNNGAVPDETQPSVAQQQPKTNNTLPATQINIPATTQSSGTIPAVAAPRQPNQTANIAAQQQHTTNTQQNIFQNKISNPLQPVVQEQQPEQIAHDITPVPPASEMDAPDNGVKVAVVPKIEEPRAPETNYAYNSYDNSAFYEGKGNNNSTSKTSISLGGGVNYGNLNTGYTAGITVRRKVSGDFFVDGTVAMMYNNNATNVAVNNGPPLAGTASRPSSFNETSLSSPALDPIQKLYYVQFNPSIGYQVEKHVALSIGGDFQQMLNKKEEIVQPESNNARIFPNFDVGLTTKSEFAITPNIQAGLMYREGLNNLIKNDGSKYVNRRYVQVQFKYNIPVN